MTTDIWHAGFVRQPIAEMLKADALKSSRITWLPPQGSFRFIADPFCLETPDGVTIFVEAYDYRTKHGVIQFYSYDHKNELTGQGLALATDFHLSYPCLIRDGGKLYMLPEAYKSGALTLYEAERFPDKWRPVAILLDEPVVDASVIHYQGRWWMFYAVAGPNGLAMRQLHVAYADHLLGPWHRHDGNPVREGLETSRPGGTPFIKGDELYLPVQDCQMTYGAAVNILRVDSLTPEAFSATIFNRLMPEGVLAGFEDGLHTLAGDGDVTVIDVKHVSNSPMSHLVKLQYKWRRLTAK